MCGANICKFIPQRFEFIFHKNMLNDKIVFIIDFINLWNGFEYFIYLLIFKILKSAKFKVMWYGHK